MTHAFIGYDGDGLFIAFDKEIHTHNFSFSISTDSSMGFFSSLKCVCVVGISGSIGFVTNPGVLPKLPITASAKQ